jgi:hypothetical protein
MSDQQHQQSPDELTVDPEDRDAQPLDQQDPGTEEDTVSGGAPQPPA